MKKLLIAGAAFVALLTVPAFADAPTTLLNASYDVAREVFAVENEAFIKAHLGVTVDQSHAGTSKQARAIVEGLEAGVVTFSQVSDIEFLAKNGFVAEGWQKEFPSDATHFTSFLVCATRCATKNGAISSVMT